MILATISYRVNVFGFLYDQKQEKELGFSGNQGLLDQIAAQETVLKEKKDAEAKAKAERASERGNRRGGNNDRRGGRRNDRNASDSNSERNASESRPHSHRTNASNNVAAGMDFPNPDKQGKGKKRKGGHGNDEDHYSRMAREAEEYSREKVLEEARAAVEEASRESTGRRKKRKEKREREAAKAQEERKIEEALAQGVNPEELDAIKVSQALPSRSSPRRSTFRPTTSSSACSCWARRLR